MKLGINSYTYMWAIGFRGINPAYPDRAACPPDPLTPLGLLEKARALGVRLVQTGPNLEAFEALSEADLEAVICQSREWQMELEVGTRGLDYDALLKQVALANRLGAKLIRTLPEISG